MKTLPIALIVASALASVLPAQTNSVIYPPDHANREGNSQNATTHITAGISRVQFSYEAWNLQLPKGAMISQFGYRQDGYSALATIKVQFEALMGHNSLPQEKLTNKFDSNYDSTPTTVIAKKIFDLPVYPKPLSAPSSSFLMLKLDKAFAYQHPKNLVTEIKVFNNSNGNKAFSYPMDQASFYSPTSTFGLACKTSGSTFPTLTTSTAVLGGNWGIYLSQGPASMPTILILGASKTKLFGSIDLPFKLDVLGMKGCFQHIDMNLLMAGGNTNTSGSRSLNFKVPLNFDLIRQKIYAQMWAMDMFANPAGIVTSNGAEVQFGAYPREFMLYYTGSATQATGWAYQNQGTVTRFDYK